MATSNDTGALSYHDILYNCLRVLGFDSEAMKAKHHTNFDNQMFHIPNRKAFEEVTYFLLKQLDPKRTAQAFRDVWPVIEKKQEAQFRKILHQWLTEIQEKNSSFLHGHINPAVFLSPSGEKLVQLLAALACHVVLKRVENIQLSHLKSPDWSQKSGTSFTFATNILSAQISIQTERTTNISQEFASKYQKQKALSETLVTQYQDYCKRQLETKNSLQALVRNPSSPGFCTESVCDYNNKEVSRELRKAVEQRTKELDGLWRPVDDFASVDGHAWSIIRSVLEKDTEKATLDARESLKKVPRELVEKYQSLHSGTKYELQYKEGRLELSAFFNLFVFALNEEVKGVNALRLPPIEGQVEQLRSRAAALENTVHLLEKVYDRLSSLVNERKERSQRQRTSLPAGPSGPARLLPLTPESNGLNSRKSLTPSGLEGVLGLSPALHGVRPKTGLRPVGKRAAATQRSSPVKNEPQQLTSNITPKAAQGRTDPRRSSAAQSTTKESIARTSVKLKVKPENRRLSQLSSAAATSPSDLIVFSPAEGQISSVASDQGVSPSNELLQLLENSFASSIGEFSAAVNSSFAVSSRDVSTVDVLLNSEGEKGLLDMSYASLVDDMLDLSLC